MSSPSPKLVLGIDPGLEGALAFLDPIGGTLEIHDMPTFAVTKTKRKEYVDLWAVRDLVRGRAIVHTYLEEVTASPQMGVVSAFSFGGGYFGVQGVLIASDTPLTTVRPGIWKTRMRAPADKKQSVARAKALFPRCTEIIGKKDGRAEAAMLALFGCLELNMTPGIINASAG